MIVHTLACLSVIVEMHTLESILESGRTFRRYFNPEPREKARSLKAFSGGAVLAQPQLQLSIGDCQY